MICSQRVNNHGLSEETDKHIKLLSKKYIGYKNINWKNSSSRLQTSQIAWKRKQKQVVSICLGECNRDGCGFPKHGLRRGRVCVGGNVNLMTSAQ